MIKLGDLVYDEIDPRHVGRVVGIDRNCFSAPIERFATIVWIDTGWISDDIPLARLRHYQEDLT